MERGRGPALRGSEAGRDSCTRAADADGNKESGAASSQSISEMAAAPLPASLTTGACHDATATTYAVPSSCDRRRRRRVARRLLPFVLATAATATTLLADAMAPPQHAFSRGGAAAGVAFQRPRPLWNHQQQQHPAAVPTPHYHPQQQHQPPYAAPIVASPSALMGAASSSSDQEVPSDAEAKRKPGSRWGAFTKWGLNKAQAMAASDDFKVLARGARTVLRELLEVDVGPVDMEKSMERLKRGVDKALTRTVMSLEGLLQMYEGRSPTAEGVLGRVRRRIAKMVRGGLSSLMTEDGIGYCLYSVNMTALMVEEMASRRSEEARKVLGIPPGEPLPRVVMGQVQRDVMREMVEVAEDAEVFAATVVGSRWFKRNYCDDEEEAAQYANLLKAKLVSRLVLAVAAGVLHGYRPTEDPLLALLVVAYASGSLTRQVAANFLGLVGTALTNPGTVDVPAEAAGGGEQLSPTNVRAGDWVIERLPDVWSAADSPEDIAEGLFRLFQALERRKGVALAKQAGSCAAKPPPPTYLATAALEAAAANPAASQLAALSGGASAGAPGVNPAFDSSGSGSGSMAWASRPGVSAAAAATAFLPPLVFQSTQQGSRLVLLAKSVGKVRRYWRATTVAAIGTMALVWLARWFVASPATSSTVAFGSPEDEEERRRILDLDAAIAAGALGGDDG